MRHILWSSRNFSRERVSILSLPPDLRRPVNAAAVAELAWLGPAGHPDAAPVTPLLLEDEPAVAFPYARAALARQVAAAAAVALVFSDDRLSAGGWQPVAVIGRPRLVEDRQGALFTDQLLGQELRKYPPARTLIDSPLLRREHWWYVPRLILVVEVDSAEPVGARRGGAGELLAVAGAAAPLLVDTVQREVDEYDRQRVESLAGRSPGTGSAVLLGHDFSPDLERWTPWTTRGWLTGGELTIEQHPDRTTLDPPLGLWQRLRRQQRLSRDCRRALDA